MQTRCDIAIVGGGLVGASLACALAASGRSVALIEAAAGMGAVAPSFDERNLALAVASLNALDALGVLRHLATPPTPIRRIHVSRKGDFGTVRLRASDYGRDAFGGVVMARELGGALEARLRELPTLTRYAPARVVALDAHADGQRVALERDGQREQIDTRLLVAADGTRSFVRTALGIGTTDHDYGQTLFVCTVVTDRGADGGAWERFTDTGPAALLPRSGGHYGSVCAVARTDAERVATLTDAEYIAHLQARIGWRAGRILRVGRRSAYPLARVVAERVTAPRALLMGNAAQTLHPIGAQGFNLGLRDALTYAELLDANAHVDPGDSHLLADYAQARDEDRARTLAFSDGLARITATTSLPLHVLRSLGLTMLGHVPGLAAPLVAGAMGFRGRVPALARGGA